MTQRALLCLVALAFGWGYSEPTQASEIIHECSLAIAADLNLHDLAQAIHAHPTVSEVLGEAAEDGEGHAIHLMRQEVRVTAR